MTPDTSEPDTASASVHRLLNYLLRPARILLIEDDGDVARTFQYWLRRSYVCDLTWAASGDQAEQILGEGSSYDMIFLNLVLPDVSGVEVLRRIKARMPDTPVVVITGYAHTHLAQEAMTLGVVGFYTKPFDTDSFRELFQTYRIRARAPEDDAYLASGDARVV